MKDNRNLKQSFQMESEEKPTASAQLMKELAAFQLTEIGEKLASIRFGTIDHIC